MREDQNDKLGRPVEAGVRPASAPAGEARPWPVVLLTSSACSSGIPMAAASSAARTPCAWRPSLSALVNTASTLRPASARRSWSA